MLRLLITRPAAQAQVQCDALRLRGWQADKLPLIAIAPMPDSSQVQRAWQHLTSYTWVFFVSPNAVEQFFGARPLGHTTVWPQSVRVAAVGPATVGALLQAGIPKGQITAPCHDAESIDSEALWGQLASLSWSGHRVLVVRGNGGRTWLADQLGAQGAHVDFLQAYTRTVPVWGEAERSLLAQALRTPQQHVWLFSSSQAIDHLVAWEQTQAGRAQPSTHVWRAARALATHPRIAGRAQAAGFSRILTSGPQLAAIEACIQSTPW